MFKNYFKTAFRNIRANRLFTCLNVAGLAIGLCVSILLFAYVSYELSFDRMFKNAKDIYRVNLQTGTALDLKKWSTTPNAVGPALAQSIPQINAATRLIKEDFGATVSLKIGEKTFAEKGLYLADSSVFSIFDFHFVEGNAASAFTQPKSLVLSHAAKQRLFGDKPAMGNLVYLSNTDTFQVAGVYEDLPKNSSIDCDMVHNIMDSWMGKEPWWSNASYETYCLLQPGASVADVQQQASRVLVSNVGKDTLYFKGLLFQPLTKIHLYSGDLREGYAANYGSINSVRTLMFLSFLILFIGCINYMNLATAQSQKRAKGVGVNKVLGATRGQMRLLFYLETGLLSGIAVLIGYILSFWSITLFQSIVGTGFDKSALYSPTVLTGLLLIWLAVTLVAGSYPAFSLSGIPVLNLFNKGGKKNSVVSTVRKSLVVFQFAASVILIITVIIIREQMSFIASKDLGYNPKGVVALPVGLLSHSEGLVHVTNDLKRITGVSSVTAAQGLPGAGESGKSVRKLITDQAGIPTWTCHTEGSIAATLQLQILVGKTLPASLAKEDTTCYVLINEAVAKDLGFKKPEDAVGKYIITEMSRKSLVTGVVRDFNYKSLKDEIGGYIYYASNWGENKGTLLLRYNTPDLPHLISQLQKTFERDLPNTAFDIEFLDKHVENLYQSEQRSVRASGLFSLLAIFIACLGLFGLVSFMAEQRVKEIAIRKVVGASASRLTLLLVRDFIKLVILAFIIASPIAWWAMNGWLQGFTYRVTISWWVFVLAGFVSLFIASVTVSFRSIRAATANPVKGLRTE